MHNDDMGKRDESPATKADIADLAKVTKADIADLAKATKADIADLAKATKADIADLAKVTKADIADLAKATKVDIADLAKTTKADISRLAKGSLSLYGELRLSIEELSKVVKTSHSMLVKKMDGFMARTVTVQADQHILIHRIDRLEARVYKSAKG